MQKDGHAKRTLTGKNIRVALKFDTDTVDHRSKEQHLLLDPRPPIRVFLNQLERLEEAVDGRTKAGRGGKVKWDQTARVAVSAKGDRYSGGWGGGQRGGQYSLRTGG